MLSNLSAVPLNAFLWQFDATTLPNKIWRISCQFYKEFNYENKSYKIFTVFTWMPITIELNLQFKEYILYIHFLKYLWPLLIYHSFPFQWWKSPRWIIFNKYLPDVTHCYVILITLVIHEFRKSRILKDCVTSVEIVWRVNRVISILPHSHLQEQLRFSLYCYFDTNYVEMSRIPSPWWSRFECLIARLRQHVNRIASTCIVMTPAPREIIKVKCFEKIAFNCRQPSVWTNFSAGLLAVSKLFPQLSKCVVFDKQHDCGTLFTQ